jgi:hypothetical protein
MEKDRMPSLIQQIKILAPSSDAASDVAVGATVTVTLKDGTVEKAVTDKRGIATFRRFSPSAYPLAEIFVESEYTPPTRMKGPISSWPVRLYAGAGDIGPKNR